MPVRAGAGGDRTRRTREAVRGRPAETGVRFAGEVALVTGGSAGIGMEIARGLVRGGARVLLIARRRGPLAAAVRELARDGKDAGAPAALARPGDLARAADVRALAAWVRREAPRLDILVNNAGHLDPRPFERLDDAAWERALGVNLMAPVRLLRALLPSLRRAPAARVVNVSSIAGVEGSVKLPGTSAYAASKAGLVALTQVLAVEWERTGPRVNAVSFGSVETAMFRRVAKLAKPGMPAPDAARMALFLASRESEPMNGRNVEFWS
jgi:NAD(P)-dependent dehydrogenase (short-subunit alcohol dehydrogenase family)